LMTEVALNCTADHEGAHAFLPLRI
jgi:hypothetical protein